MAEPIEFYFDFSSPYGYLASCQIDDLAARHGRTVRWRPFLLGVAFKETGQKPLVEQPLRGPYHLHDFARSARRLGLPFRLPTPFPFAAIAASRAFYWLEARDAALANRFAKRIYQRIFGEGQVPADAAALAELAAPMGIDGAALAAGINDPAIKDRLRQATDEAIKRGVFGSPFIYIDGEPFWGHDRLGQVEEWLARGGW
ncbi:2-hydroxychromene-2-carboxylate isomerase [Hypericibacter adhaerens]|uniref:2-hydroxychromene-2-carboxylate isomerase n=1 Tax=Hypericibacter adhaerens TaxID=2602016 RepID=A0A5J6MWD1_9PROT|nr:2-hydroxychromene-2-carboxylate isomerase [Hypericibacter adhaerens]QEX21928.1 2-hydroxychromene-2-carboxylate isomerase [Hypericibacter adhaerens]